MIGMLFDVAIVGSGLSGLITGAFLVKRGFNVLMVEIEEQSIEMEHQGYRLGRFPGAFYGFGKGQIFSEIFTELGIPFLDKKRFLMAEPAHQVIMPSRRIDVSQDRDDLFKAINFEFPQDAGRVMAMMNELDRHATVIRNFFTQDLVYPPTTFQEKRIAKRLIGNATELYRDSMETPFSQFLAGYDLGREAKTFVESQIQFLSPMYPDNPSLAFAANLAGLSNGGIFQVEGGIKVLENIFKERISSYRGVVHRSPAVEGVDFGRYTEVKLADQKEPFKCKALLLTMNPESFFARYEPKTLEELAAKTSLTPPEAHDFVLYIGIDENVVPVGMAPNAVLVADPRQELINDNMIMLSLTSPTDEVIAPPGKRLIAARMKVRPSGPKINEAFAEVLAEKVLAALRDLMPFFDDFFEFCAVKESYRLYVMERKQAWFQAIDDDKLGVGLMPNRTPNKSVFYTGPAVLPGLGMEGEAISARTIANILSDKLAKN
ncbi:MAG: NAD(P)/FAD-dependent oxidoreductase [Deltaproteobacteria bacterium]|nr:NAD(P)/FAD-dependent oxidoreductase [Deltaproteobacteria bacterium]MCB9479683.1 NAD(P)/FAD-dependent oxidoreductase [Deltaproteobacteria bacterium]MCB9488014.1 NAD(P)/FAD-dependent oxidoreductase [Deltaproteobacteria bacterium]